MTAGAGAKSWSLRRRLAAALTAAVVVLWLGASLVAGAVIRHEVGEVFDGALQEVAQRVLPLAYAELVTREDEGTQHVAPIGEGHEYISYVVRDQHGNVLLQSSDASPATIPVDLPPGFSTTEHFRAYSEAAVQGTVIVTAVADLDHRQSAVRRSMLALIWPLAALVPLAVLAVWLTVRLALKPVDRFRLALEGRDRGNLSPIGTGGLPDEIAPLAGSANGLIDRLRGALEAERSFTANSAHELRTPIAAALAQTQRLLAELGDDSHRQRAQAIAGSLRRLARLSEKLLQLAKAEGGGLIADEAGPLAPVLRLVIAEVTRDLDLEEDRLALTLAADEDTRFDLDPDAFAILARNLIENAIKHGSADVPVDIRLDRAGFEVSNGAPLIDAARLARLTRPFERGTTTADGAGLGLAIAAAICRGAGLTLTLASPRAGATDGFAATVHFARKLPEA